MYSSCTCACCHVHCTLYVSSQFGVNMCTHCAPHMHMPPQATRDQALSESRHKSEVIAQLEGERETLQAAIEECQQRLREDESQRRKLHNTIQELRGEQGVRGRPADRQCAVPPHTAHVARHSVVVRSGMKYSTLYTLHIIEQECKNCVIIKQHCT